MIRRLILLAALSLPLIQIDAQEFDCEVTITTQSLTAEARENLSDFVQQLKQYINNYRWTKEDFGSDKLKCTIDIFFQGVKNDNHYFAQAFVGSQRPIHKQDRNTAVLRTIDDRWEFDYIRFQPLIHDEYRFDPLLSFVDFYMYLILGYDFDTFTSGGGTAYFQKAYEIVNKARSSTGAGKGWEISSQSVYSRGTLIDELINDRFRNLREAVYKYHYRGLDLLRSKPEKAKQNILSALEGIGNLQQKINTKSISMKLFFDTKYQEIAQTFVGYPDATVYLRIAKIDPSHQSTYEDYSSRVR